jgi:hypothetical protein
MVTAARTGATGMMAPSARKSTKVQRALLFILDMELSGVDDGGTD